MLNTRTIPSRPLSITQLNRQSRELLENHFSQIWVEGEISNFLRAASGHCYFTLKDSKAQIRCALFKGRSRYLSCTPKNGLQVLARGKISLYEPRGDYQFIVDQLEEVGSGLLQRKFEALKTALQAEGLFAPEQKQSLPAFPKQLGVITSSKGAALHDVLHVLQRRYPSLPVIIYPCAVQGQKAAAEIVSALQLAQQRAECDLLLLVRGGGSLEDLWPFNEEIVAQAIFDCSLPIISGIGHEIDFTISDFVADLRAPTPSAAAELATPDQKELQQQIQNQQQRLIQLLKQQQQHAKNRLNTLQKRLLLQHPQQQIQRQTQQLDQLEARLNRHINRQLQQHKTHLFQLSERLSNHSPHKKLQQQHTLLSQLQQRLENTQEKQLQQQRLKLSALSRTLQAVSPLATLGRGYSISRRLTDQKIISHSQNLNVGDQIETQFAAGNVISKIESVR
ncbi:MAG: exodeoxyribonuclease VII large subunit [Gammaproteobacteria bacterium]|nr:exodeoxyribonuclease VII large subunit [Gammaproteobacteria bacterium]